MRAHGSLPHVPASLARRMAALDLDLVRIARSEPDALRRLRMACAKCGALERCARDLQRDPAGPMPYCPNARLLNFLTDMWWLRTLL